MQFIKAARLLAAPLIVVLASLSWSSVSWAGPWEEGYGVGFNDGKVSCSSSYQEGFDAGKASVAACPTKTYEDGLNEGKASVAACPTKTYEDGLNEGKASVAACPTKTYEDGLNEGKASCPVTTCPTVNEKAVQEACKAKPETCGITVGSDEKAVQEACKAKPETCGIVIEESDFGANLVLNIPSVKSGNDTYKPVIMSYLQDGLIITETDTQGKSKQVGKHIFQVDSLSGVPLPKEDALGALRIIGDIKVEVTENGKKLSCEKLCKAKLGSKIEVTVVGTVPTEKSLSFGGDCTSSPCKLTIEQPYHVVVVSTTTVPTYSLKINKTGTGEVRVFVNNQVDKTCSSKELTCTYLYSEKTNTIIQAVASKQPAPFEPALSMATEPCPDGSADQCRKVLMNGSKEVVVSF